MDKESPPHFWNEVRLEAEAAARKEKHLASFLAAEVLAASSWEEFLAGFLSSRLETRFLKREELREMFLEGYRAFDIERLNLPLVPAVGSPYLQGGVYGGTVCFPVPDIEKNNNPNIVASEIITGVRGEFTPP